MERAAGRPVLVLLKGVPTAKCIRVIGFAWVLWSRQGNCHLTISWLVRRRVGLPGG